MIKTPTQDPMRLLKIALDKWEERDAVPTFKFRQISKDETLTLIRSLGNSGALGHEGLDSIAKKSGEDYLWRPIQHMINISVKTSKFANLWKLAKVVPRLKSRELDKYSTSSYRPVAILPVLSKLIERTAQQQLLDFLERTGQINGSNHAYRKNYGTTTTLAEVFDEIYEATEDRKKSSVMTADQSSAFDTVHHPYLIEKLRLYNVGQEALDWFQDYLTHRTQYVQIGGARSNMTSITRGIPQGSVIGPLLYSVFVNELSEVSVNPSCRQSIHNETKLLFGNQCSECGIVSSYADDTTYTVASKTRESNQENLTRVIRNTENFLNDNQLCINLPKTSLTECMIKQMKGRTRGTPPQLEVRKTTGEMKLIENKLYTRILGANLQGNELWTAHLETGTKALFPTVRKQLGKLRHAGNLIPRECRNSLAKGLIQSRLSYLLPLWGGATEQHLRQAQVIWNTTARWVTGRGRRTKMTELMTLTGWMTIKEQIRLATAIFTWKIVYLRIPRRLNNRMTLDENYLIQTREPRLQFSTNCYRWRAASQWNALSLEMRTEKSIAKFKGQVRRMIIGQRNWDPGDSLNDDNLMTQSP